MANKRSIVEINGRKYDANTGQMITDTPTATPVIDGFTAPIKQGKQALKPVSQRTVNTAHAMHQPPQKTKKLHPAAAKKQVVPKRVMAKTSLAEQKSVGAIHQPMMLSQRMTRAERATQHAKSEHIRKFNTIQADAPAPAEDIVEPEQIAQPHPVMQRIEPAQTTAQPISADTQQTNEVNEPGTVRRIMSKRPKLLPTAAAAVLLLTLIGYATYQNIPNMALRVAAQRAGFDASLPGYSPAGFGFAGPVAYSEGVVELQYDSNSDERSYQLVQRESTWDSQSLLDNFVAKQGDDYLTFRERGLTVYIYDTSNATWVDGGIWYTIEGNSLLNSEQLLKIAGSL